MLGKTMLKICSGNNISSVVISKDGADKEEEECEETSSLLSPSLKKGGIKGRRRRSRSKKVQWNDRNGNKLVEVLEFQLSVHQACSELHNLWSYDCAMKSLVYSLKSASEM